MNLNVFKGPEFTPAPAATPIVYPRLYLGALHAVLGSGAFTEARDRQLSTLLHGWLQRAHEFNDRLLVTETRMFTNPTPTETATWQAALTGGAGLRVTRTSLQQPPLHPPDPYSRESGIPRATPPFSPAGSPARWSQ